METRGLSRIAIATGRLRPHAKGDNLTNFVDTAPRFRANLTYLSQSQEMHPIPSRNASFSRELTVRVEERSALIRKTRKSTRGAGEGTIATKRPRRLTKRWVKDANGLVRSCDQEGREARKYASKSGENELKRLARGVFVEREDWERAGPRRKIELATLSQVPEGSRVIIAGVAAAVLHGLPLLNTLGAGAGHHIDLATSSRLKAGQHGIPVRRVSGAIQDIDVVRMHGRRVTDVPKTVIDICRSTDLRSGLVVADAALRGWTTKAELLAVLDAYRRSPGNRRAREVIAMATELSGSVGESLTKLAIVRSGLANDDELLQQVSFSDGYGEIGRVDFYIPALGLVIEFDGDVKYSNNNARCTEQVMTRELKREKRLKNLGLEVVRLTWRDVIDGDCVSMLRTLRQELTAAIAGGKRTYRGAYLEVPPFYTVPTFAMALSDDRQARWAFDGRLY